MRIPPLPPAEAGTRCSDPGGMQGWVDLCYVKADRPGLNPRPVNRKSNALPLNHHATRQHLKRTKMQNFDQTFSAVAIPGLPRSERATLLHLSPSRPKLSLIPLYFRRSATTDVGQHPVHVQSERWAGGARRRVGHVLPRPSRGPFVLIAANQRRASTRSVYVGLIRAANCCRRSKKSRDCDLCDCFTRTVVQFS